MAITGVKELNGEDCFKELQSRAGWKAFLFCLVLLTSEENLVDFGQKSKTEIFQFWNATVVWTSHAPLVLCRLGSLIRTASLMVSHRIPFWSGGGSSSWQLNACGASWEMKSSCRAWSMRYLNDNSHKRQRLHFRIELFQFFPDLLFLAFQRVSSISARPICTSQSFIECIFLHGASHEWDNWKEVLCRQRSVLYSLVSKHGVGNEGLSWKQIV